MTFNENFIELRKSKGLSQDELVKGIDVQDIRNKNLSVNSINIKR